MAALHTLWKAVTALNRSRPHRSVRIALVVLGLLAAACTSDDGAAARTHSPTSGIPGDCIVADLSVSPEKLDLLTRLAGEFNESDDARVGDECVFARVQAKSSGGAAQLLATGWDEEAEGPDPSSGRPRRPPGARSSTSGSATRVPRR